MKLYIYIYIFAVVPKCYTEISRYQSGIKTFHSNRQTETIFTTSLNLLWALGRGGLKVKIMYLREKCTAKRNFGEKESKK